jgi:hypothetical protein
MAAQYRKQVANLAQVLNREENRSEAAALLRSLVDRIELRPNSKSHPRNWLPALSGQSMKSACGN